MVGSCSVSSGKLLGKNSIVGSSSPPVAPSKNGTSSSGNKPLPGVGGGLVQSISSSLSVGNKPLPGVGGGLVQSISSSLSSSGIRPGSNSNSSAIGDCGSYEGVGGTCISGTTGRSLTVSKSSNSAGIGVLPPISGSGAVKS
uniref:ORF34 n=1 Tax=Malaco herpesvirus 1 TaxID=3031797 RepID=A0AA48SF07_9VIRU|nr:TPA_asm: ORF34 [Malaco herpesvirus 1]